MEVWFSFLHVDIVSHVACVKRAVSDIVWCAFHTCYVPCKGYLIGALSDQHSLRTGYTLITAIPSLHY